MALLEELRGDFTEHDVFLHLLLGLVSVSRRLERVLPPEPTRVPQAATPAPLTEEEERRVMLLLGLVSARRTLLGTLEPLRAASRASTSPGASEPREEGPTLRELLR
jgi:hypothetical protein